MNSPVYFLFHAGINKHGLVLYRQSTLDGIEALLDRVYTLLTGYGYDVWMSHKGTMPVRSNRTAFENCLAAVDNCDLFLGIITPHYGKGWPGKRVDDHLKT